MRPVAFAVVVAVLAVAAPVMAQLYSEGHFTASDGVKIHYYTAGASGSWVVLIHGYTDNARRMWFDTGIAPALAKSHRVVALDNRNHGQSDKPVPGGTGRAEDVIELMNHLKIEAAHIHGYSMGGGITARLLTLIPQRFITAGFGGSGIQETDPELRKRAMALDEAMPKPQGEDAAGLERFRKRVSQLRPATPAAAPAPPATPAVDLKSLSIPILAVNGSFDNPHAKTQRLWREARIFQNVILEGRTHLTAIATGERTPKLYIESITKFIDVYDRR